MRIFKISFLSAVSVLLLFGLVGCGTKQPSSSTHNQQSSTSQNSGTNGSNSSHTGKGGKTSNPSQNNPTTQSQSNSGGNYKIVKEQYNNSQTALKQLNKVQKTNWFYPKKMQKVDLGYEITAQSGSIFGDETLFKWSEGRWSIEVLTGQKGSKKNQLAKQIVKYLHTYFLPVPRQKGFIIMKQDINNPKKVVAYVYWQDNQEVYHVVDKNKPSSSFVTTQSDPLAALKKAVSMNSNEQASNHSSNTNTLQNGYPNGTPKFAGTNVTRSNHPQSAPSAIPNGYSLTNKASFALNQNTIIDSWSGLINNKKFLLDIYRNKKTKTIVIGDKYNGKTVLAKSLPIKDMSIYNFTGTNFVYHGKYYGGVNLINGKIISAGNAIRLSGCFPCMGGHQAFILGLNKKYAMKPVGD